MVTVFTEEALLVINDAIDVLSNKPKKLLESMTTKEMKSRETIRKIPLMKFFVKEKTYTEVETYVLELIRDSYQKDAFRLRRYMYDVEEALKIQHKLKHHQEMTYSLNDDEWDYYQVGLNKEQT